MNVLFLTLVRIENVRECGIYTDLMRKFRDEGHNVYIVTPHERRFSKATELVELDGVHILGVKTLNIQKTNVVEKGVGTLLIESQYKFAIKKYLSDIKFDLILYSTPPITFTRIVKFVKRRNPQAISYLLLKDIFPQNAVDIGMFGKNSLFYKMFRKKEIELYKSSDYIGCMSSANVDYIIKHNPGINKDKVEICPNSMEITDKSVDEFTKIQIRKKYGIPVGKKVFVYGGNLGKPQGIPFLIECLEKCKNVDAFFLIVGDGTEFGLLRGFVAREKIENVKIMNRLPKEDYDIMVGACDVGMIFLDHRFTIPNFPSRLLSYMQAKLPILAVTDPCTDVGKTIVDGGFGWWCESNDSDEFLNKVNVIVLSDLSQLGQNAYNYLVKYYDVRDCVKAILLHTLL